MNLHKYEDIDNGYMKDYVYKVLRKNIMELRLKPGISLKKERIAEELQVSITPIREAFARLAEDELVNIYPQRGTYVSFINLEKVGQAKFMRDHLEKAVVKIACNHQFPEEGLFKLKTNLKMQEVYAVKEDYIKLFELDNEFHKILFEGCKKGDIWTSIQQISIHVSRLRILSLAANFNRKEVIADHQNIVNAIDEKNEDLADTVISRHIGRIKFDSNKLKEEYPGYFEG